MKPSNRINSVSEYYFSKKLAEVKKLQDQGNDIINLGIGNPDLLPHLNVLNKLAISSLQDESNKYQSYRGLPELRIAFGKWYKKIYNVDLISDTEILPL